MGADFLYSTFPKIAVTAKRIKEFNSAVDKYVIVKDNIQYFMDEINVGDLDEAKEYIKDAFLQLYVKKEPFGFGNRRDVSEIILKGKETHYISGGMSWGDLPTESCETFNAIWSAMEKFSELYKLIFKWMKIDQH